MIYRIDVKTNGTTDSLGDSIRHQIQEFGSSVSRITTSRIFLIDTDAARPDITRIATELLSDKIVETADVIDEPKENPNTSRIEIHLKPGVMDPVADSTEMAIRDMGLPVRQVRTGRAYLIHSQLPKTELEKIANRVLANGVIESVHFKTFLPQTFETGHDYTFTLKHIELRNLTDPQLTKLSRDGHLFLSLPEMKAIQNYFQTQNREPTDIELETLAQTWSEHCVHKTLKSAVDVEVQDENGKVISTRHYKNLIKETIFKSTMDLMATSSAPRTEPSGSAAGSPFCLSVFSDNAGVIAFDETHAICFKVETHNHPSAIEPYGGSATGIGGVIRDILGTGLGAKPIANTDIFCVAYPDQNGRGGRFSGHLPSPQTPLPKGIIHPKRILQQIVAGVRDYGNRMGIPTVNGAVYFDNNYLGNPLVFCGCVGLIPNNKIQKQTGHGDAIVVMGGRTGRDGIHGATFSSAELTDTHADEFSHAVQIGNAITEKKVADVILQARDRNLFSAITDCGAGGLSSAIGEMGEKTGATVDLDKVPLKYNGLRYDEIWISEAQERMVLSVPPAHVNELLTLCQNENVEVTVIGTFGTPDRQLILNYHNQKVGQIAMHFLHDGIPTPTRKAIVTQRGTTQHQRDAGATATFKEQLLNHLAHPNIASKHWIIRQYDHEVQGSSVIKPLTGPKQIGPSDAAVLRPKLNSYKGIAIGCGLSPQITDPYEMAIASIDEAIRNVIAVGADYTKIAILDNFCWPSVDDEKTMGTLVRACEACHDAALAYGIPFISGKDSLHNQFTNQETGEVIRIPNTLLISALAIVQDVRKSITMDFKKPGSPVYLVTTNNPADLHELAVTHRALSQFIATGSVAACHDISDGGIAVAAAEMAIASNLGLTINPDFFQTHSPFTESPGRYLIELIAEIDPTAHFTNTTKLVRLGTVQQSSHLVINNEALSLADLTSAWRGTLDW